MRPREDRGRKLGGILELALGLASEAAYVGALFAVGALVCLACLAIHA